jgi:hypothetical protein
VAKRWVQFLDGEKTEPREAHVDWGDPLPGALWLEPSAADPDGPLVAYVHLPARDEAEVFVYVRHNPFQHPRMPPGAPALRLPSPA